MIVINGHVRSSAQGAALRHIHYGPDGSVRVSPFSHGWKTLQRNHAPLR